MEKFIKETDILLFDEKVFGDKEEHMYDCKCYDGYAVAVLSDDEDAVAPKKLRMKYPKRKDIVRDREKAEYVLEYRGLFDLTPRDITYGDIMMAYGEIDGVVTDNSRHLSNIANKILFA